MLAAAANFARRRTPPAAKRLFLASLIYLPLLWILLLVNRV
jgi:heme O synthase-like polyprenyltransferase